MLSRLDANGLTDQTMIILTAKHANSPVDRATLRWVDPARSPPLINSVQPGLTAQVTADTMALIWLKDRSRAADVAAVLQANAATIGAGTITSGSAVATLFDGQLAGNPSRIPDLVVQPVPGVVFAAPNAKLVDHGSGSAEDTHVPLVVVDPRHEGGVTLDLPRLSPPDRPDDPRRARPQGEAPRRRQARRHQAADGRRRLHLTKPIDETRSSRTNTNEP